MNPPLPIGYHFSPTHPISQGLHLLLTPLSPARVPTGRGNLESQEIISLFCKLLIMKSHGTLKYNHKLLQMSLKYGQITLATSIKFDSD